MNEHITVENAKPYLRMYGLAWHVDKSDAVREILIKPLSPWVDIEFIPWDGKNPPELPPPEMPVCFFEFAPPCQDPGWRNRELTWIPMWDHAAIQYNQSFWWKALPAKWRILSFSGSVEKMARDSASRKVLSVRYQRDTSLANPVDWSTPRVLYYWNRLGLVGPKFLKRLCFALKIDRLLFRPTLDPSIPQSRYYELPPKLGKTEVKSVPFFPRKADYEKLVDTASVVLAPRPLEGVGMVMLDALSRGCAVIAADLPTANEYIQTGVNGILLPAGELGDVQSAENIAKWYAYGTKYLLSDYQDWVGLAATDLETLGKNARSHANIDMTRWNAQLEVVAAFLCGQPEKQTSVATTGEDSALTVSHPPLISICVPHLNSMPYTRDRIESIKAQTWRNWECIVVDSGSTDGSLAIYEQAAIRDKRFKIYNEPRLGIYPAFNAAVARANGKFVYIATADDTLHCRGLELMGKGLMEHPECGACHTPIVLIDEQGKRLPRQKMPPDKYFGRWQDVAHIRRHPHDAILFTLFECMYTSVTQMLYRRDVMLNIGPFPSEYGSVGDFAWNLRLSSQVDILHLPFAVATWRRHNTQASRSDNLVEHARSLHRIVQDNIHYLYDNNSKALRFIEPFELIDGHRLNAFSIAINSVPLYLQRACVFLYEIARDPGLIFKLSRCEYRGMLSLRFNGVEVARNITERMEGDSWIVAL